MDDDCRVAPRAGTENGGGLDHVRDAARRLLDLAQVDAIPTDLDEEIAAPRKEDSAVGELVTEIAGSKGQRERLRASQYPLASVFPLARISPSAPAAGLPRSSHSVTSTPGTGTPAVMRPATIRVS